MTGSWCMLTSPKCTLLKIETSRFIRSTFRGLKSMVCRDKTGTPNSLAYGNISSNSGADREKKYKSTLAVAVAGTAIGVSHLAAISGKYRKKISGKSTLCVGLGIGAVTAGVWYNYVDAAYDGVTEDDISMMFEMANSTGYGSLDDEGDSAKAMDILHAIVTGKVEDSKETSESLFKYEEDEEDEDDDDDDDNVFGKKVSFSDTSSKASTTNRFGSMGIGKSLPNRGLRKSFIPDLDKADKEEVADGWLDIS